ncbi:hypothetical protein GGX14DRAFT_383792 [Mycena pura]|uniref:Uncharacterized protein n=1 Tax=Mycena pura TaxID=153505 RepID=A0AAD7E612_9AGAR|nr:hypothetical protein GGX14DRAFT_383792 [Mycena pura]
MGAPNIRMSVYNTPKGTCAIVLQAGIGALSITVLSRDRGPNCKLTESARLSVVGRGRSVSAEVFAVRVPARHFACAVPALRVLWETKCSAVHTDVPSIDASSCLWTSDPSTYWAAYVAKAAAPGTPGIPSVEGTISAVLPVLNLAKAAVTNVGVPGLEGAINGVVELATMVSNTPQMMKANKEDLAKLEKIANELIIIDVSDCSDDLTRRLTTLASYVVPMIAKLGTYLFAFRM